MFLRKDIYEDGWTACMVLKRTAMTLRKDSLSIGKGVMKDTCLGLLGIVPEVEGARADEVKVAKAQRLQSLYVPNQAQSRAQAQLPAA
jgi:hypothetical protein